MEGGDILQVDQATPTRQAVLGENPNAVCQNPDTDRRAFVPVAILRQVVSDFERLRLQQNFCQPAIYENRKQKLRGLISNQLNFFYL